MKRHQLLTCGAFVLCVIALISSKNAPSRVDAASPLLSPTTQTVPLYALASLKGGYFYTANAGEKGVFTSDGSWFLDKIACYVLNTQAPGTVPLYRVRQSSDNSRFLYTIDVDEYKKLKKNDGGGLQGIACYIAKGKLPGTVPLYRLVGLSVPTDPDDLFPPPNVSGHSYYTTNLNEANSLIETGAWGLVRIEGYVWPGPTTLGEPAPPAPPESYYTQLLSDLGCNTLGLPGKITCASKQGYFDCEYYRKDGKIKVTTCVADFKLADFNKLEADLVDQGCKRFAGRPGEYICESWNGGDYCDSLITTSKGLVTKCFTPRKNLVLSYLNSFGRNPTDKETSYWSTQLKTKSIDYKGLMQAHSQWLKTAAASAERKGLVNRSYYEAFGRYPTVEELNYTTGVVESNGTSYADLVKGHIDWMLGGNPQQINELRETIKRAFKNAGNNPPAETEIQQWITQAKAEKLSFKKIVVILKSHQFPKGSPSP